MGRQGIACLLVRGALRGWQTLAGRRAREAAHGAKADKPKRYEPRTRLQDLAAHCPNFWPGRGGRASLALGLPGAHAGPARSARDTDSAKRANMNSITATLVIRERLRQRLLPHHGPWRCQGEYAGGCLCDGCGERITSAQASYEVDFAPGVTPHAVKLHRACFEIWQCESESQPSS